MDGVCACVRTLSSSSQVGSSLSLSLSLLSLSLPSPLSSLSLLYAPNVSFFGGVLTVFLKSGDNEVENLEFDFESCESLR